MSTVLAVLFAALALVGAAISVTRASAARALTWLLAVLLAVAGTFFALAATFAGALQILIYAGAVVAVFVFVLITVDVSPEALETERRRLRSGWPVPALAALLVALPFLFKTGEPVGDAAPAAAVAVKDVGALLFGPWAIAVEVASFLLLAGLIGVRHFGRGLGTVRPRAEEEEP